ncbi:hypothetical protein NDU88_003082 [Pleurodeles waltl]|uniref:Uncharacterized protein n=1 Tax=Pleurodeles waltl TaxID=8319 RepID=A0AAV7UD27_PLEWA|nr:hypothetical protein NDU88_003082 [Pleurodeles waltl]
MRSAPRPPGPLAGLDPGVHKRGCACLPWEPRPGLPEETEGRVAASATRAGSGAAACPCNLNVLGWQNELERGRGGTGRAEALRKATPTVISTDPGAPTRKQQRGTQGVKGKKKKKENEERKTQINKIDGNDQ